LIIKTWLHALEERTNVISNGQTLIEEWYEVMDTEKFSDSHPVNGAVSDTKAEECSQAHYDWIKQAEIAKTPTSFMNGYELPSAYRVKDLVPLIPGLVDAFGNQNGLKKMIDNSNSMTNSEKKNNV